MSSTFNLDLKRRSAASTLRPCLLFLQACLSPQRVCLLLVKALLIVPVQVHAGELYPDDLELELAEIQAAREQSMQSTFLPSNRGQSQGVIPAEPVKASPFGGTLGVDFRSQYFSYGLVIQGEGITTQPYLNLRYTFLQDSRPEAFVNNVTGFLTTWSDFSSNTNLSSPASLFKNYTESDLIFGASLTFEKRYNLNLSLTSFVSPAGAYGAGAFARAILMYDDINLVGKNFGMRPQVAVVYSLPSSGHIGLKSDSFLFEPGLTPNYTFSANSSAPLNVALPMRLGLGNDFFAGSTYGYFSVGPQFTLRLPFLSNNTTNTNLSFGYTYVNLGPTAAEFAPNNNSSQNLFNLGISISF